MVAQELAALMTCLTCAGTARLQPARAAAAPAPPARKSAAKEIGRTERTAGGGTVTLSSTVASDGSTTVSIDATQLPDGNNLVLHWGVSPADAPPHDWAPAPQSARPQGTTDFGDGIAARSPLGANGGALEIKFPADAFQRDDSPKTLLGILVRSAGEDDWLHAEDGKGDLSVPLQPPPPPPPPGIRARQFAERVAKDEAKGGFNLFRRYCAVNDSLVEAFSDPGPGSAGVILTWLRLSSNRQLAWCELKLNAPGQANSLRVCSVCSPRSVHVHCVQRIIAIVVCTMVVQTCCGSAQAHSCVQV